MYLYEYLHEFFFTRPQFPFYRKWYIEKIHIHNFAAWSEHPRLLNLIKWKLNYRLSNLFECFDHFECFVFVLWKSKIKRYSLFKERSEFSLLFFVLKVLQTGITLWTKFERSNVQVQLGSSLGTKPISKFFDIRSMNGHLLQELCICMDMSKWYFSGVLSCKIMFYLVWERSKKLVAMDDLEDPDRDEVGSKPNSSLEKKTVSHFASSITLIN